MADEENFEYDEDEWEEEAFLEGMEEAEGAGEKVRKQDSLWPVEEDEMSEDFQ